MILTVRTSNGLSAIKKGLNQSWVQSLLFTKWCRQRGLFLLVFDCIQYNHIQIQGNAAFFNDSKLSLPTYQYHIMKYFQICFFPLVHMIESRFLKTTKNNLCICMFTILLY